MSPANENRPKTFGTCPICGKPAQEKTRPFCSRRCADVDLQRWFTGRYAVPVVEDEDPEDEPPPGGREER